MALSTTTTDPKHIGIFAFKALIKAIILGK